MISFKRGMSTPLAVGIIIVLAVLVVGTIIIEREGTSTVQSDQVFSTKKECEEKTGCECGFVICDYVPPGKTFEEVCGKDFKKGWQCRKVNGIPMNRFIEIAEDYALTKPKLYFNNTKQVNWDDEEIIGSKLNASWIITHKPEVIYHLPDKWPEPYTHLNGKYVVRWFFIPGCEENIEEKIAEPNWFDERGRQCVGGYVLNILINENLEIEQVLLDQLQ